MSYTENLLTGQEIITEINGRILSIDETIKAGYISLDFKANQYQRKRELRNLLNWIDKQNQLRAEEEVA